MHEQNILVAVFWTNCGSPTICITIRNFIKIPVDNFGTVVGESPDFLLLSGTVVGENPDHVCWDPYP